MNKSSLPLVSNEEPWYSQGLNFECTGCGKCCTGAPGYIWVTEEEILAIAEHLAVTVDTFMQQHVRKIGNRFSLNERPVTYDCVFLEGKQCQIYKVRPVQCQTYPWWPNLLGSREEWEAHAPHCEGISKEGKLVNSKEIASQEKRYLDAHPQDKAHT